jgi:AsmA protein
LTRKVRWFIVTAAFAAVLAGSVLTAAATIDPNDYKPWLISAVQDATGRNLALDGPLRVKWSLWPTLQVNGARLSNPPGGSRPDMAMVERIEAQISLPALFRHRIDVLQLRLVGPNVLFEVAGSQPNWVLTPPSTPPSTSTPYRLLIRAVHVQNGMVTSRLPARTRVIGLRTLDVRAPPAGGLTLSGTLVYSDNQPFTLQASAHATGGLFDPWRTDIRFAAYDTTARGQGTMTLSGNYDLDVTAQSGTLDKLNALLPEMDLPAIKAATLSAHITSNPVLGSLPVFGPAQLSFDSADLTPTAPGLTLGKSTLSLPAPGGKASIATQVRYAGQPVALSGSIGVPRQPDEPNTVPIDLTAKAASNTLSLTGHLQLVALGFAGLDAAATLRTPDLATLRPLLTPALPPFKNVTLTGRLAIPANAGSARMTAATLTMPDGDVAGDASVDIGKGITATLHATRIDLDAVLQAFGIDLSSPSGGGMGVDTPLPWAAITGPKVDLTAAVASLSFQHQDWRDVALSLQRGGGKQAATLRIKMPGGPASLSMTADTTSHSIPVTLSISAPAIPLALLAHEAGVPGVVTGAARMEAQLHASGQTLRDIAASLDGPFSITATGGQITNAAFIGLTPGVLAPLGITVPAQGNTAIRCIGLVGTARTGVVRLRTIALETTHLSLSGAGQVDLAHQTVELKLHPFAQVAGSPVEVPVVVDGPFSAISGRLDADGLDKVGLLIDGLFGGDTPDICSDAGLVPGKPR